MEMFVTVVLLNVWNKMIDFLKSDFECTYTSYPKLNKLARFKPHKFTDEFFLQFEIKTSIIFRYYENFCQS